MPCDGDYGGPSSYKPKYYRSIQIYEYSTDADESTGINIYLYLYKSKLYAKANQEAKLIKSRKINSKAYYRLLSLKNYDLFKCAEEIAKIFAPENNLCCFNCKGEANAELYQLILDNLNMGKCYIEGENIPKKQIAIKPAKRSNLAKPDI